MPNILILTQTAPDTFTSTTQLQIPNGRPFDAFDSTGPNSSVIFPSSLFPSQLTAVDINADGFMDLAEVDPNIGQITLLVTSGVPISTQYAVNTMAMANGAISQFAVADFGMNGYDDIVVPASGSFVPNVVLNGTINVAYYSYTPVDGQTLTGENFINESFTSTTAVLTQNISGSSVSAFAVPVSHGQNVRPMDQAIPIQSATFVDSNTILFGRVFTDANLNSKFETKDRGVSGITVYLDLNKNGVYDPDMDPSCVTDAAGFYSFNHLNVGQTYTLRVVNPSDAEVVEPMYFTPSLHTSSTLIECDLPLASLWSTSQDNFNVQPLVPVEINLTPTYSLATLGVVPHYYFTGAVPVGMRIDSRTGQIYWVPPASMAGKTVPVSVEIVNGTNHSGLLQKTRNFFIHVEPQSQQVSFINAVYGTVLHRLPTKDELATWVSQPASIATMRHLVSNILASQERVEFEVKNSYLTVLNRLPNPAELASALSALNHGGNTDQLMLSLLTGPEFVAKYQSNAGYVAAVNKILIPDGISKGTMQKETVLLSLGRSRTKVVQSIMISKPASQQKVKELSNLYLGQPMTGSQAASWVNALVKGTLNSDQLTAKLLLSSSFQMNSRKNPVPNLSSVHPGISHAYNQLSHVYYTMTGTEASRQQLDALQAQISNGHSYEEICRSIYNSTSAQTHRIQIEFQNLLKRTATQAELTQLLQEVPLANLSEGTQIHVLISAEYRAQFASTSSYVDSVYRVLTIKPAPAAALASATHKLDARTESLSQFVNSVASSKAGKFGQIDHRYADMLLRDPTQLELKSLAKRTGGLQDQAIILKIANQQEFRVKERSARLL